MHVYLSSYEENQAHILTEFTWKLRKHQGFTFFYKET